MDARTSKLLNDVVANIHARNEALRECAAPKFEIDHSKPLVISDYLAAQLRGDLPIGLGHLGAMPMAHKTEDAA